MSYLSNLLLSVDHLGNSVAGGHPGNTLSGRTCYLKRNAPNFTKWYWNFFSQIINAIYYPLYGKDHCEHLYQIELDTDFHRGSDIIRFILSFVTILIFPLLSLVLYPLWLLRIIKPNAQSAHELINSDLQKIKRIIRRIELTAKTNGEDPESQIPDNLLDDLFN